MIQISETAQDHFRQLIQREGIDGLGVRLSAIHAGTPRADVRLEFAEPADLNGEEWAIDCDGFTVWLEPASVPYLDGAEIDFVKTGVASQLQIRAPNIKGKEPDQDASLIERVQYLIEHEVNPQLAQHRGSVAVDSVDSDNVVWLRFGGGCQGCGMADVTLKQGIEKSLMSKLPEISAVRDVTDHASGAAPYIARESQATA